MFILEVFYESVYFDIYILAQFWQKSKCFSEVVKIRNYTLYDIIQFCSMCMITKFMVMLVLLRLTILYVFVFF